MARGKFVIRNKSSYPDEEVKSLVRFACAEMDMSGVLCHVGNTKRGRDGLPGEWSGLAMDHVPHDMKPWPQGSWYAVKLLIGPPSVFPMSKSYWRHGEHTEENPAPNEWPTFQLQSWQEALVKLAAHEAYHISQYKNRNRKNRNRKNRHSELAADKFAAYMLEKFLRR